MSGDLKWAIENGDLDKVKDFIDSQKFYWIRIIQKSLANPEEHLENILKASTLDDVRTMGIAAREYQFPSLSSLHYAAMCGQTNIFTKIFNASIIKDPVSIDDSDKTPLHFAAENGHLSICQFVLENVKKGKLAQTKPI